MSDVDRLLDAVMADHKNHQFEGVLAKPYDLRGLQHLSVRSAPLE
jgi:hypothetical protein